MKTTKICYVNHLWQRYAVCFARLSFTIASVFVLCACAAGQAAPAGCDKDSDCMIVRAAGSNWSSSINEPVLETTPEDPAKWPPPAGPDYDTNLPFVPTDVFLTDTDGKSRSDKISLTKSPDPKKPGFNFIDITFYSDPAKFGAVGPNDINEDGLTKGYPIITKGDFKGYIDITPALNLPAGSLITAVYVYSDYSPEPSSLLLFGSGILGIGGFLRKRLVT